MPSSNRDSVTDCAGTWLEPEVSSLTVRVAYQKPGFRTVFGTGWAVPLVGVVHHRDTFSVVEVVFTYPGIGQTMVDAVRTRDIPVVQACTVIFAATYIILNLIADIVGIVTNPRLLHPR